MARTSSPWTIHIIITAHRKMVPIAASSENNKHKQPMITTVRCCQNDSLEDLAAEAENCKYTLRTRDMLTGSCEMHES